MFSPDEVISLLERESDIQISDITRGFAYLRYPPIDVSPNVLRVQSGTYFMALDDVFGFIMENILGGTSATPLFDDHGDWMMVIFN